MRILKKILRIIAIILPCFCFGLISSPTLALKYPYEAFNIYGLHYYDFVSDPDYGNDSLLANYYYSTYPVNNALSSVSVKSQVILNAGRPCYSTSSNNFQTASTSSLTNTFLNFDKNYFNGGLSTLPSAREILACQSFYRDEWYKYDSIYISGQTEYGTNLFFSSLFDVQSSSSDVDYIYEFGVPLSFDNSVTGSMSTGRRFHFSGQFIYSDIYASDSSGDLISYDGHEAIPHLLIDGVDSSGNFYNYNVTVGSNMSVGNDRNYCTKLVKSGSTSLKFDCYFSSPVDLILQTVGVSFRPYNNDDVTPVFAYSIVDYGSLSFYNWSLVTDRDATLANSSANYSVTGTNLGDMPGYDVTNNDPDFTDSLTNLFDFSFLNPFSAFFSLFTDNSGCVSITTIAGMINSSETSYCPWFSANTRNILTPVLGIAGIMLIFGFLVHWLGSSSGNLFEDSSKGGK